ncbi:MAG: TolC family protein [Candidatus Aminicenantes bacterium]|nr:TolC family protein [Candidatus Aminicenantes bacterium]MDH5714248.1 TolC family protein [Candidatus Aminicenantes bacterium]
MRFLTIPLIASLMMSWLSLPVRAQEERQYTLSQVYRIALKMNEEIKITEEQYQQSGHAITKARSAILPHLSFNFLGTHYDRSVEFTPLMDQLSFDSVPFEIMPQNTYTMTVSLGVLLFDGGRSWNLYKGAKTNKEMTGNNLLLTRQGILLAAAAAYYDVIKAQKEVELTRQYLELAEKQLRVAQSRFRVGEVTKTAVLQAELDLLNSRRELIQKENELKIAKDRLSSLVGIEGDYQLTEPTSPPIPEGSLDELLTLALQNRLELRNNSLNQRLANMEMGNARGRFIPTVSTQASFLRQNALFPSKEYASIGINVALPIFDGGLGIAEMREAKSMQVQARLSRDRLVKDIELDVTEAYLGLESLTEAVKTLEKQVQLAEENYQLVSRFFAVGEATSLELSQALNALDRARKNLTSLRYDRHLAILNLQKVVGIFAAEYIY